MSTVQRTEENGQILDAFMTYFVYDAYPKVWRAVYDDCEIERVDRQIFVRWYDPEHMKHCDGPRVYQVIKVKAKDNDSYAFEEV